MEGVNCSTGCINTINTLRSMQYTKYTFIAMKYTISLHGISLLKVIISMIMVLG